MEKKILVVDDEQQVCDMLKKFLLKKDYRVSIALSGKEAIAKVKKEKPHVVLLDILMAEMDGVETLKRIKKIDQGVDVVMITAVKQEETAKKCRQLGAYDYITKPLDLEYLEAVLLVKLIDIDNKKKK